MPASRNRVQRLMRVMGLLGIYRRPLTNLPEHRTYPYLLGTPGSIGPSRCGRRTSPTCPWAGIPLLGGSDGLAQRVCGGLVIVQNSGSRLLRLGHD